MKEHNWVIKQLRKNCKGKSIRKTIPFTNDDVPNYLKFLKQLEIKSRSSKIEVK